MKRQYDVIIVGAGPAGLTCAMYLARAGVKAAVIEKMAAGGQAALADVIDNYPGLWRLSGAEIGAKMAEQAVEFGADIVYADVKKLSLNGEIKSIITNEGDGGAYEAKALVLCMGAEPKTLGAPGEERLAGRGVSYCATCDGAFFKHMDVAIVGGGNTAVKDALYLSRFAKSVNVIVRRDRLRALGVEAEKARQTSNVRFVYNAVVREITGGNSVDGIIISDTASGDETNMSVNGVFIAVGMRPRVELLDGSVPLDENGWIIAGEDGKTAVPGVYAAGDIRTKALRQVVTAASDGANCANSILEFIG